MMSGWLFFLGGLVLAAFGTSITVAAAAISRVELTRWISHRLRGAALANVLLANPGGLARAAAAVATIGMLVAGAGLAAAVPAVSLTAKAVIVLLGGIPIVAVVSYAIPRAIGQRWCEPIVGRAAPWTRRLSLVLRPLMPGSLTSPTPQFAEVLRGSSPEDLLDPKEVSIVSGVLDFTQRPVHDVMTPRTEVVAFSEGVLLTDVGRLFAESGYSRLPIFRDSLDQIIGMVYAFDLLKVEPGGQLPIRPVTVAPRSRPCADLFVQLQRERRQLAVVLDEFGGTAGIVTLEDLLELLVGDFFEELDEPSMPQSLSVDIREFDGSAPSGEVASRFGVKLPRETETIGGLLVREAGRIPQPGDRFTLSGLEFDVVAASPTRVERIRVRRGPVKTVALTPGSTE